MRVPRKKQVGSSSSHIFNAVGAVVQHHRGLLHVNLQAVHHTLHGRGVTGSVNIKGLTIGSHIVEADNLQLLVTNHLIQQHRGAAVMHTADHLHQAHLLIVIPEYKVVGDSDRFERIQHIVVTVEMGLAVEQITCMKDDLRIKLFRYPDDLLQLLLSPCVAQMNIGEVHCTYLFGKSTDGDGHLFHPKVVGVPYTIDRHHQG